MKNSFLILILILLFTGFCHATQLTFVSDTSITAYGPIDGGTFPGADPNVWNDYAANQAVLVGAPDPNWVQISGANWISTATQIENPNIASYRMFELSFSLPEWAIIESGTLYLAADNKVNTYFNNGSDLKYLGNWGQYNSLEQYDISNLLISGTNLFQFVLTNSYADQNYEPLQNPTGLIFKAEISYSNPVPEPATMFLFSIGLLGIAGVFRKKK